MRTSRSVSRFGLCLCLGAWLTVQSIASADVKVAFTGDQGTGEHARSVLQLIASEATDLLVLQGDLAYDPDKTGQWETNLNEALGRDFPVIAVVGNHEEGEWPAFRQLLAERMDRVADLSCDGDLGAKAVCSFRGLSIVQVAPGIDDAPGVSPQDNYPAFIERAFAGSDATWRICSWHKNQRLMQVGGKGDETGWGVYQACLNAGAMIATGHEHSYSRTFLMDDFENQSVRHRNDHLELDEGRSFAFVSGLGGWEIRDQEIGGDWWASAYTSNQGATHGALFCSFGSKRANCYFKDIAGTVPDSFTLESLVGGAGDAGGAEPAATEPEVDTAAPLVAGSRDESPGVDPSIEEPSTTFDLAQTAGSGLPQTGAAEAVPSAPEAASEAELQPQPETATDDSSGDDLAVAGSSVDATDLAGVSTGAAAGVPFLGLVGIALACRLLRRRTVQSVTRDRLS